MTDFNHLSERRKLLVALDSCGSCGNSLVTALDMLGVLDKHVHWFEFDSIEVAYKDLGDTAAFHVWCAWRGIWEALNSVRPIIDAEERKFLAAYRDEQRRLKLLEQVGGKRNTTRARGGLRSVRCAAPQSVGAGAGPKSRTAGGQAQARPGKSRGRRRPCISDAMDLTSE